MLVAVFALAYGRMTDALKVRQFLILLLIAVAGAVLFGGWDAYSMGYNISANFFACLVLFFLGFGLGRFLDRNKERY